MLRIRFRAEFNVITHLQIFAGFEADRLPGRNCHFLAGPGIPPYTAFPWLNHKYAKAAKFDSFSTREGFLHRVKQGIHGLLSFHLRNAGLFGDAVDDI